MTDISLKQQIGQGNQLRGEYNSHVQRKAHVNEFRRTHFIFGKHPTTHYSAARFQELAGAGKLGGRQQQTSGAAKNQKTNFNIGTGLSKQHQYATTYNQVTGVARGWNQSRQTYGDVTAKKTSVQLGKGNPYGFVTTNQRLFPNKDPNKAIQQPNKDFISSIKSSHFEVGSARPKSLMDVKRHYLSEANVKFNMKGNASQLRAKLDESKKNDLRRNHFTIGGPTANFKNTTANINYRPMTATQRVESRPSLNQEKMNSLRASHWTVGAESSLAGQRGMRNTQSSKTMPTTVTLRQPLNQRPDSAFVTTSMINYKWVQPFPSKIV